MTPRPRARELLLERFRDHAPRLGKLVERIGEHDLDRAIADGRWTIRRLLHHLADTALVGAVRIRTVVATPGCTLERFAFDRWEASYDGRSISTALAAFVAVRAATAELLERLPDHAWDFDCSLRGETLTLESLVVLQCEDSEEHLDQLRAAAEGRVPR